MTYNQVAHSPIEKKMQASQWATYMTHIQLAHWTMMKEKENNQWAPYDSVPGDSLTYRVEDAG